MSNANIKNQIPELCSNTWKFINSKLMLKIMSSIWRCPKIPRKNWTKGVPFWTKMIYKGKELDLGVGPPHILKQCWVAPPPLWVSDIKLVAALSSRSLYSKFYFLHRQYIFSNETAITMGRKAFFKSDRCTTQSDETGTKTRRTSTLRCRVLF